MCVEAECGESRGMGTEADRETERPAGMGCRTRAAAESAPDRSFGRLGAEEVLTGGRRGGFGFLFPEPPPPALLKPPLFRHSTVHHLFHIAPSRTVFFYFILFLPYPWTCAIITYYCIIYDVNDENSRGRGARVITERLCKSPNNASAGTHPGSVSEGSSKTLSNFPTTRAICVCHMHTVTDEPLRDAPRTHSAQSLHFLFIFI